MDSTQTTVKPSMIMTLVGTSKLKVTNNPRLETMKMNVKKVKDIVTTQNTKTTEGDEEEEDVDVVDDEDFKRETDILGMPIIRRKKLINNVPWKLGDMIDGKKRKNNNKNKQIFIAEKNGMMKARTNDFNEGNKKMKPKTRTFGLLAAGLGSLLGGNSFQFGGGSKNTLHIIMVYRQRFPFITNPVYYYDTNYAYIDNSQYGDSYYYDGNQYGGRSKTDTTEADYTDTVAP